jgi:hypothetical protein
LVLAVLVVQLAAELAHLAEQQTSARPWLLSVVVVAPMCKRLQPRVDQAVLAHIQAEAILVQPHRMPIQILALVAATGHQVLVAVVAAQAVQAQMAHHQLRVSVALVLK